MDYVVVRTHVVNHARFLEAGSLARDLWTWGMLYAGQHETDGELPMVAVLASPWGYGSKRNVMLADKLVEVGLWERYDLGYRVLRWVEMGNKTKAELDAARAKARLRMKDKRLISVLPALPLESGSQDVRANCERTSSDVPSSHSYSSSSSLNQEIQKTRGTVTSGGPPEWFQQAVEAVAMNTGLVVPASELGARWLQYDATCSRDPRRGNARDAAGWLTSTLRSERAKAQADEARRKPYEAPGAVEHRKTKAEREADAEFMAARMRELSAKGTGT